MHGQVTVWKMTEEERLAYIKKHPIKPKKKLEKEAFGNIYSDYKWRGEKGAEASKKARQ